MLQALLPDKYEYKIVNHKMNHNDIQDINFCLEIRVNVRDQNDVKLFLSHLSESTGCTFNVQSGRPDRSSDSPTARSKYSGFRKCCMNVAGNAGSTEKENRQPGKNTNCGAKINFRLDNPIAKFEDQRKDKENFPLWLKIDFQHNHSISRAEFLKYRSVSEDTKAAFTDMFQQGFSPSTAHAEMRRSIKAQFPDSWPEKFADRSKLPSIFWSYYWHRQWMDKIIGSREGVDAFEKAVDMIKEFDKNCKEEFPLPDGECYAKIAQSEQGQTVVAIVDPFMRRVHHTIPQCGELVLIDATSNLDREAFIEK